MSSVSPDIKFNLFLVMSNQNFVLSDQDGVLVGHISFQEKKYDVDCEQSLFSSELVRGVHACTTIERRHLHVSMD